MAKDKMKIKSYNNTRDTVEIELTTKDGEVFTDHYSLIAFPDLDSLKVEINNRLAKRAGKKTFKDDVISKIDQEIEL